MRNFILLMETQPPKYKHSPLRKSTIKQNNHLLTSAGSTWFTYITETNLLKECEVLDNKFIIVNIFVHFVTQL